MSKKTINTSFVAKRYLQSDSDWASLPLGDGTYNIGQVGCALTCAAMLEEETPKYLYDTYNMTEELCNWSKMKKYNISTVSKPKTDLLLFRKIFQQVCMNELPLILLGNNHDGTDFETHFVVVYGFKGTVGLDVDGGIIAADDETDFSQFKVYDPSNSVLHHGNSTNVEMFNERYPIVNLRITSLK